MSDCFPKLIAAFVCIALLAGSAVAQEYPTKRVAIVAPVPPAGPMDFVARTLASGFEKRWNQTVIVENKPGAGALIGAQAVASAAPDGHTLLIHNTAIVAYRIFGDTKFDAEKDLAPVSTFMQTPWVLFASADMPGTLKEVIARAKAEPGKLNIAVIPNTIQQLRTAKLLGVAGMSAAMIPYPGTAPVQRAMLANEVQLYMASSFGMERFVKEGRIRAIATLASDPYWLFPEVPTAKSQGVDFQVTEKYFVFAPPGTPRSITAKVATDIAQIVKEPQVIERVRATGNDAVASTPEQVAQELAALNREAQELAALPGAKR